jgi:hypothetical protein
MGCEIDHCPNRGERMIQLETDEQILKMDICRVHERALLARLKEQAGKETVVFDNGFWGTCGELQDAIAYLDESASAAGNA